MTPALPPGFVLDGASGGGAPPLPPGFVLDGQAESAPTEADAAAIVMPNRFARHTGQINPGTLPTTDEARTAIEGWSVPDGLSLMGIAKNTLLGALDIGQGRVQMGDSGNPLSIRPTGPSFDALGLGAGLSPAAGTGRAITQMAEHGAPLADLYQRNRLMPPAAVERPAVATVAPGAPVPEMRITPDPAAAPAPQSVGASATPTELTAMTPREAAASQATGDRYTIMETPKPGDTTEYIPGIKPTKAEVEMNPATSLQEKVLKQENRGRFQDIEAENNVRYIDFFDEMAGTPTMLTRMQEAREEAATQMLKRVWQDKMKADSQPIFDHVANVMKGEDGRRPLVRSALDGILSELVDETGKRIADPEVLYGVRKHIGDLLSKEAGAADPLKKRVATNLAEIRDVLDQAINAAAPGFRDYLRAYAEASRPIDVLEILQAERNHLTNGALRVMSFPKFDRFMKDLIEDRAARGVNQAKSIPDGVWEKLVAMHKSLQRRNAATELAAVAGSDSTQRLSEMMRQGAMQVAAHAVVGTATGGLGNLAIPFVSRQIKAHQTKNRLMQHINPDLSKYPDRGP